MNTVPNSRRSFVMGGLAVAGSVVVAGCGGGGGASGTATGGDPTSGTAPAIPLIQAEANDWQKLVGTTFQISTASGAVPARLASVTAAGVDANRPATLARHQAFFASFDMAANAAPAGGRTYQLSHGTAGIFDLFLGQPSNSGDRAVMSAVLA